MKVTIKGGYEAAKGRIYNESLEGKQKELDKIKLFRFDTLNEKAAVMIQIITVFCFALSFLPLFDENSALLVRCSMLFTFFFTIAADISSCKSERKRYMNLIEKHKSMSMIEYIKYVNNDSHFLIFDDEYMIDSYNDLQKFASLLDPDIVSIEYTRVNGELSSNVLFFVKKKNNQKDAVDFGLINILYRDSEEDELVWDEDSVITLYTNDKGFVKKKDGEN